MFYDICLTCSRKKHFLPEGETDRVEYNLKEWRGVGRLKQQKGMSVLNNVEMGYGDTSRF